MTIRVRDVVEMPKKTKIPECETHGIFKTCINCEGPLWANEVIDKIGDKEIDVDVKKIFDVICDFSSAHSTNGYRFRATCFTDKLNNNEDDAVRLRNELANAIATNLKGILKEKKI